jgi:hypothetical protein
MSAWDPFELSAAPLSAYTPGQGDIAMEGKMETASGAPVYHLEDYLAGNAPYVTGATNKKNPSGQTVYRTIGDNVVPVKITDYGPGVKGIDIASSNSKWATNFPYQGSKDMTLLSGPAIKSNVPAPTSGGSYAFGTGSNMAQMGTVADYAAAKQQGSAVGTGIGAIGSSLAQLGQQQARQGQVGMSQAMAMLQQRRPSAISQLLPPISGGYYG